MVSGVLFTQNKKYLLKSISLDIYTKLFDCSPGSAGSAMAKSANGSVRSGSESGDISDMEGDNINVVVRVRPLSQKENRNNDEGIIQFPGEGQIWVDEAKGALKPFTFNVVFEPEATQEDVLEHSGMKRYAFTQTVTFINMSPRTFRLVCNCNCMLHWFDCVINNPWYGQTLSSQTLNVE